MQHRLITSAVAAFALAGTCLAGAGATQAAAGAESARPAAHAKTLGHRSLGRLLAADGHHFDRNWRDFDLADAFIRRVVHARPHSPLAIIYHGRQPVTAFLPTDAGFRRAAAVIVGRHFKTERGVYRGLWRVGGLDGVENVLSYHLVAGRAWTYQRLVAQAPTTLTTMQGGKLKVRMRHGRLTLIDFDSVSPNAHAVLSKRNLNEGNRQLGQGITNILSPVVE
jgi:hypothetical protein